MDSTAPAGQAYKALSGEQIRLLELHPGEFHEPMVISLSTANLTTCTDTFEALSYVWGDAKDVCETAAVVDGVDIFLTKNLDVALRHLRYTSEVRRMWVDAICINQGNVHERGHQVSMMARIYTSARQVIVWTGPAGDESEFFFETLAQYDGAAGRSELTGPFADTLFVPRLIWSIYHIALRPWFTRIWVVQEVVAKGDPYVSCGFQGASWNRFGSFIELVCRQIGGRHSDLFAHAYGTSRLLEVTPKSADNPFLWRALAGREDYPSNIWDWELEPQLGRLSMLDDTIADINHTRVTMFKATFPSQFKRTMYLTATDARDKVYAILGICNWARSFPPDDIDKDVLDWQRPLEPDYSQSTENVFARAAVELIMNGLDLTYNYLPLEETHLNLPSWVPDLTQPLRHLKQPLHPYYLCPPQQVIRDNIDKLHRGLPWAYFSPNARVLYAGGLPLGRIIHSMQLVEAKTTTYDYLTPQAWEDLHDGERFTVPYVYNGISLRRTIKREIVLDALLPPEHPESSTARSKLEKRRRIRQYDRDNLAGYYHVAAAAARHMTSICAGRWFFVTDMGQAGLTAGPVQVGDELVGLFGINLPFVLRKRDEQASSPSTHESKDEEGRDGGLSEEYDSSYRMVTVAHVARHELGHENSGPVRYHGLSRLEREMALWELGLRGYRIE